MLRAYKQKFSSFSRNTKFLIVAELLNSSGITFWALLFNFYLRALGFSKEEIGNTLLFGNLAIALCAFPLAFLSNRHRYHRMIAVGQLLSLLFFFLSIFLTGKTEIRLIVMLAFACTTAGRILVSPFIMENSSSLNATYVFSLYAAAAYIGGTLGNLLGGFSSDFLAHFFKISVLNSYRIIMGGGLLLNFFGAIVLLLFVRANKKKNINQIEVFSFFKNLNWNYFLKVLIPSNLIALGAGLIVQFMNIYLKETFRASDSFIGVVMALQSLSVMLGTLLAPFIAEKIGKIKAVTLLYAVSIPFMVGLAFTTEKLLGSAAVILRSALMNMAGPLFTAVIYEHCYSKDRAFLNAFNIVFWAISWALAAFIYANIFKGNYTFCFLFAAVLYTLATFFFFHFFGKGQKTV